MQPLQCHVRAKEAEHDKARLSEERAHVEKMGELPHAALPPPASKPLLGKPTRRRVVVRGQRAHRRGRVGGGGARVVPRPAETGDLSLRNREAYIGDDSHSFVRNRQ